MGVAPLRFKYTLLNCYLDTSERGQKTTSLTPGCGALMRANVDHQLAEWRYASSALRLGRPPLLSRPCSTVVPLAAACISQAGAGPSAAYLAWLIMPPYRREVAAHVAEASFGGPGGVLGLIRSLCRPAAQERTAT